MAEELTSGPSDNIRQLAKLVGTLSEAYTKAISTGNTALAMELKKQIRTAFAPLRNVLKLPGFEHLVVREKDSLRTFFGKEINVPPLPAEITAERYERWKDMGMDIHYLPAEDMRADRTYPGLPVPRVHWQPRTDASGKQEEAPTNIKLPGAWVLIDTHDIPSVKYDEGKLPQYEDDPLANSIANLRKQGVIRVITGKEGGSRFLVSKEELQKSEVKREFAQVLGVTPDQLRLPRQVEMDVLQHMHYPGLHYWPAGEWHEDYGAFSMGRHHTVGFRPIVVFSPEETKEQPKRAQKPKGPRKAS